MQSTAEAPAAWPTQYAALMEDARLAEQLGLHSLWITEHRFWYDGWCPAPLVAAAAALGATTGLHVGTGITVLPLHDPRRLGAAALELHRLTGGRFELGVGLGYRIPEYDGLGLPREGAGKRMASALDDLLAGWHGEGPRVWVGGIAETSIKRAVNRGLSLILPQTLRDDQLAALISDARATADGELRIAVIRHAWVTDGSAAQRAAAEQRIADSAREYAGAWWFLKGHPAFDALELLEQQVQRNLDTALIGTSAEIAADLRALAGIGVDLAVLQIATDRTYPDHRRVMDALGRETLAALRTMSS